MVSYLKMRSKVWKEKCTYRCYERKKLIIAGLEREGVFPELRKYVGFSKACFRHRKLRSKY